MARIYEDDVNCVCQLFTNSSFCIFCLCEFNCALVEISAKMISNIDSCICNYFFFTTRKYFTNGQSYFLLLGDSTFTIKSCIKDVLFSSQVNFFNVTIVFGPFALIWFHLMRTLISTLYEYLKRESMTSQYFHANWHKTNLELCFGYCQSINRFRQPIHF